MTALDEIDKILFSEEQIAERVKQLGETLTRDYEGKNPLFVCVLKGAMVFFSDLIRKVDCPLEIDFISASSYKGTVSGELTVNDIPDITGRDVVVVEDIVDTAKTLSTVKELFLRRGPASLKFAALLDKPSRRAVKDFELDYSGFVIEDHFVVGYGLDVGQRYRNLPYIGVFLE